MRTALDIVRALVDEEQRLAQRQLADARRLDVVRAQLGALRKLAGVQTPARRPSCSGPTRPAPSSARPAGRKAARARRAPRRARPLAPPPAEERPVRAEVIARAARGKAIREVIARAREEQSAAAAAPPSSSSSARSYTPRRTDKLEPGATFGCWTVLREAPPDSYGRVLYRARASCCGVEANKGRGVLERGREACTKCVDRTQQGVDQPVRARGKRGPNACRSCGTRHGSRVACAEATSGASPWVRCKLLVEIATGAANQQAQAFTTCGSLMLRKKCAAHLVDVHGLEVAVAEVGRHFDQVDPKQGGGE